jgi:ribosome-associated protein
MGAAPLPPPGLPAEDASVGLILATLDDAKAENVVSIDLVGKTTIADAMVIASGRSNRHVAAIAEQLLEALGKAGRKGLRVEGLPAADWVLIDAGDAIIHVFRPEVRDFYNLEKMWSSARPSERSVA